MDNTAVATTLLTYTIAPSSVPISSLQTFTVTVGNSSSDAITVNPRDSIIIGNLTSLTAGNVTVQQPAAPWRMAQNGSTLRIWTTQPASIPAQGSVAFVISAVQVLGQVGSASLTVLETIAGNSNYAPPLDIEIVTQLTVSATAIPPTVGLLQFVKLQWQSTGANSVTIQPGPNQTYPTSGYTTVRPAQNAPTTTYTVTAVGSSSSVNTPVKVTLASPILGPFTASPSQNIGIADQVTLAWTTTYASQVQIQPAPSGSPYVQTSGSIQVQPKKALPVNASQVTYELTASGYGTPATGSVTITFAPLVINWFRYSDFTCTSFTVGVTNAQGYVITSTATPAVLTATGPGGPLTAQLGGTGPEVQVLLAQPATVPAGSSTQLQYLVKNVTTLILNPGGQSLPFDSTGKGAVTVTPSQTTTYSLVASNGQTTVTSQLQVVVTS